MLHQCWRGGQSWPSLRQCGLTTWLLFLMAIALYRPSTRNSCTTVQDTGLAACLLGAAGGSWGNGVTLLPGQMIAYFSSAKRFSSSVWAGFWTGVPHLLLPRASLALWWDPVPWIISEVVCWHSEHTRVTLQAGPGICMHEVTWPWLMWNFNIQPNCSHLYFAHCLFLKCQVMPPIGTGISMFSDCNSRGINMWQKVQQIQGWCVGKPSVWWELVGFSVLNLCSLRSPSKTWANVSHHVSVWDSHYLTGYETEWEFWMCPSVEVLRWRGRKPVCQCSTCRQGCPSPWWNLSDRTADTLKPFS